MDNCQSKQSPTDHLPECTSLGSIIIPHSHHVWVETTWFMKFYAAWRHELQAGPWWSFKELHILAITRLASFSSATWCWQTVQSAEQAPWVRAAGLTGPGWVADCRLSCRPCCHSLQPQMIDGAGAAPSEGLSTRVARAEQVARADLTAIKCTNL